MTVVPEQLDAFAQALGVRLVFVIFRQIYIDFMMLELLHWKIIELSDTPSLLATAARVIVPADNFLPLNLW